MTRTLAKGRREEMSAAFRSRTVWGRRVGSAIGLDEGGVVLEGGVVGRAEDRIEHGLGRKHVRAGPRQRLEADPGVVRPPGPDAVGKDRDREAGLEGVDRRLIDA